MSNGYIFISHTSKDDEFVKELRQALEIRGITVWVDSRSLRGSDKLNPEIEKAIEEARGFIAVLSPNTINSPWVRKEIKKALEVEKSRRDEGYRVVPILLPGIEPQGLGTWFDEEPVGVKVEIGPGGLMDAMSAILAALDEQLPYDKQKPQEVESRPVEELVLKLSDPKIVESEGTRRASATATLSYEPADPTARRRVESKRYTFTAPLGAIETGELQWYLERYHIWPTGIFKERAERVEKGLPEWGQVLYKAALGALAARESLDAWWNAVDKAEGCFSVLVDSDLPEGTVAEEQNKAKEAATELLSLPWEIIHDGRGYLFSGKNAVRVRRRLPNRYGMKLTPTHLPVRILLISPRPEDGHAEYFDHRSSALPLVDALEGMGELVALTILDTPTFPALEQALKRAKEPFDVVHFDGHGVYDPRHGLGALCFEAQKDKDKLEGRESELIHAERLAGVMRDYSIPLVFLDACQTAKTEDDPTASVAALLLEGGVTSGGYDSQRACGDSQEVRRGVLQGSGSGEARRGRDACRPAGAVR